MPLGRQHLLDLHATIIRDAVSKSNADFFTDIETHLCLDPATSVAHYQTPFYLG